MTPPKIIDGTNHINSAVNPDSKEPSSLDQLIKIPLITDTFPLISSRVNNAC